MPSDSKAIAKLISASRHQVRRSAGQWCSRVPWRRSRSRLPPPAPWRPLAPVPPPPRLRPPMVEGDPTTHLQAQDDDAPSVPDGRLWRAPGFMSRRAPTTPTWGVDQAGRAGLSEDACGICDDPQRLPPSCSRPARRGAPLVRYCAECGQGRDRRAVLPGRAAIAHVGTGEAAVSPMSTSPAPSAEYWSLARTCLAALRWSPGRCEAVRSSPDEPQPADVRLPSEGMRGDESASPRKPGPA